MIELSALVLATVLITRDKPYLAVIPVLMYQIGIPSLEPFQYGLGGFIAVFIGFHAGKFLKIFE